MYNQTKSDPRSEHHFKYNNRGCGHGFKEKFAEHFSRKGRFDKFFGGHSGNQKAANIQESKEAFVISLYAAGLSKNNFKISVSEDILTIAYTASQEQQSATSFSYQEYELGSFERAFQLNGKVLTDAINASYIDGVLIVTLPKNPATNIPAQEVPVS